MLDAVLKGLRILFRNRLRSFLTIGGIAVGVLSLVVISSVSGAGRTALNRQLDGMGMDSIVITGDLDNSKGLDTEDLTFLSSMDEVDNAMPLMNFFTTHSILGQETPCMLWGVNQDADQVIELTPVYGRLIHKGDLAASARVCVIDEQIALNSYRRGNIVGKSIALNVGKGYEDFTVVGVVKNGVNLLQSMMGDVIPGFVYIPYTTLQESTSQYCFDEIVTKLKPDASSDQAAEKIEKSLVLHKEVPVTITVQNLLKQKSQLDQIMNIVSVILSAIAAVSLVVSGLSTMTVMMVSVNERTREIGIKKSIGATNADIMGEFLLEAVLITFLGGLAGSALGIMISMAGFWIFGLTASVDWGMILGVLVFSMLIGLIFGVYPAARAAKLKPVEALRFGE